LDLVSDEETKRLAGSTWYWLGLVMDNMPLVGQWLLCIFGNARYRQHVRNICSQPGYLREAIEAHKACDLLEWMGKRITAARATLLATSTPRYLIDKLMLSWLPTTLHRLLTDTQARRQLVRTFVIHPIRLCLNQAYRKEWLVHLIEEQCEKGVITPQQADLLGEQAGEKRMQAFIRDFGLTVGLEVISKVIYVMLAVYGFSTRDFLAFALAAFGPIPPSGIIRTIYVLAQLIHDLPHITQHRDGKLLWTRVLGVMFAPWRVIGNLFAPLEMFAYYSDMSLVLSDYVVSKMVDAIPVFGGRGKLLEYWTFHLTYNFPLSVKRAILRFEI
jgi:hypothetical protein